MTNPIRLPSLNEVRMVGRLTRDPELRYTSKGTAVCKFDVAVNRRFKDSAGAWQDDVSFIPVTTWRDAAQRCGDRLKKGSPVLVEGRLKSRAWETKDGQKRSGIEVEASRVQFLERQEGAPAPEDESSASAEAPVSATSAVELETAASGEEIPF